MPSVETFPTDRLIASRFQPDDFDELCRLHRDPKVMATLGGVRSDNVTRRFLDENLAHWDKHGFGFWMFRDKIKAHVVGRGCLKYVEVGGSEEIEMGYTLRADYWGKGLATEMAQAMVNVGFEQLGLEDVVCFTLTTHHASQRVMEKAGFIFERNITHEDQPHVLYRLKKDELS